MVPDTNVGVNTAAISEVSDDQETTVFRQKHGSAKSVTLIRIRERPQLCSDYENTAVQARFLNKSEPWKRSKLLTFFTLNWLRNKLS